MFQYKTVVYFAVTRDPQELGHGSVTDFSFMFLDAAGFGTAGFNQPIGGWDTRRATILNGIFFNALDFNSPIGDWVISRATDMRDMFRWVATLHI